MRTIGKWLGRALLAVLVAALLLGLWKREEITRLMAVNTLFDEGKIISNFSNMDAAFLTTPVQRGDNAVSPLPYGATATLPPEVDTWIAERTVTGLVVLKNAEIVFEGYYQGTKAEDKRIGWSIAKSFLSALVGVLVEEGAITSLDDPVTRYAPELIGSAYDGASLRNVLQMSSGVLFDEDYLDPNSDINRMGRILALGGKMDDFAAGLTETFAAPGETWKYVSIDTHVVSMVVRGATGRPIAELLSEKIIAPLGLEAAPYYLTDGVGTAFVLGGLNMTVRDFARMGQMFVQGGTWQGRQVVPADWVTESSAASAPIKEGEIGYGYQWYVPKNAAPGEFMARGIYGQHIYINTQHNVVIANTAADRTFRKSGVHDQNVALFRLIVDQL